MHRDWRSNDPKRAIFNNKRTNAKRLGIPFTLTFQDVAWPER